MRTTLETDDPALDALFRKLHEVVAGDEFRFQLEGGVVRTNPNWVRDHIHEMKAYKLWAKDLTSYLDLLFRHQIPSGAFHEMIISANDEHATYVTYGVPVQNRRVEPTTPMAIMHGDNSGMYAACGQLARIWRAFGDADRERYWMAKAMHFREATNRVCWNGRFYTHQVHLPPSRGVPGVDEKQILSLSNPYDINRGLPDHKQAVSILQEYRNRREKLKGEYVCKWFSIHPPYPMFYTYGPGQYASGAIFPLVGGELCKAAFAHEMHDYAIETLNRCKELVNKHGTLPFALSPKGEIQGGGPCGWGAAAFYSAIVEELAGVVDESTQFRRIRLQPRWAALGCRRATFTAAYGPTGAFVTCRYALLADPPRIELDLSGDMTAVDGHVLLPRGLPMVRVEVNGREIPATTAARDGSAYADFTLAEGVIRSATPTRIVIRLRPPDDSDLTNDRR